ncbi:MAG TPA: alpha/beta hydrolase, partial [Gammaproteobacteria bacterium]
DLDLVRRELGIAEWTLYGVSYGTRVAQHYLRRYGEHVRAVILDGVLPPELDLGPEIAEYAQRTLDDVFSRCAADRDCAGRFPDLEGALNSLFDQLDSEPLVLTMPDPLTGATSTHTMTTRHLQAVLRLMSYSPDMAALLPLLISEADAGRFAPLVAQSQMIIGEVEQSISFPMHNSVVCTEDVAAFDEQPLESPTESYLGTVIVDALRTVCTAWPAGIIDDDLKSPLSSTTPVLLLSGEYDPITPPEYGEAVLENLSNARHLVGPGQGHVLAPVGCVRNIMREFLDELDPEGLPANCLDRESHAPFFLDFTGPAP